MKHKDRAKWIVTRDHGHKCYLRTPPLTEAHIFVFCSDTEFN